MKPLSNFQGGIATVLLALLLAGAGCNKKKPAEVETPLNKDQEIVNLYYNWATLSQQHNFYGMMALVYPGSNFDGMTHSCKEQWDSQTEMYFAFNSVTVRFWESDGTPYVVGKGFLYQGPAVPVFSFGFASGCAKMNGSWKLDGMNDDLEPDWWK